MQEEKRKADEARKHADSAIERNNRLIVNILAGRSYEETAQMLGISVEDYSFQHLSAFLINLLLQKLLSCFLSIFLLIPLILQVILPHA